MDQEILRLSSVHFKEEPPEQFVVFLPSPDDNYSDKEEEEEDESQADVKKVRPEDRTTNSMQQLTEEEEEDIDPKCTQANVKEEPADDCLLELLPTPKDQPRQPRTRQCTKKGSISGGFKMVLQKSSRSVAIHKCATCDVKFARKESLDRHQNEYHGVVFKCNKCPFETIIESNLKRHQGTHDKPSTCETCQKKFSRPYLLKYHQMQYRHGAFEAAPEEIFVCGKCDKTFSSSIYLRNHQRRVHNEKKAKCDICGKICKNRTTLIHHSRCHIEVECSICHKKLAKRYMTDHLQTHSDEYFFECDHCEYSSKMKENLRKHIEGKHLKKKICNEPLEKFVSGLSQPPNEIDSAPQPEEEAEEDIDPKCTQANLKEEPNYEPDEDVSTLLPPTNDHAFRKRQLPKKNCCPRCDHKFLSKRGFQRHLSSTTIHNCPSCDANFPCKLLRDRHQKEFHGIVLKCDKCTYQTKKKNRLWEHKRIHNKRFACSTCQKKFSENKSLNIHQMHHKHGDYSSAPEAQQEPSREHCLDNKPKLWVKSVKLARFDARSKSESTLFQTFLACPHCQYAVRNQKNYTQHLRRRCSKNQATKSQAKSSASTSDPMLKSTKLTSKQTLKVHEKMFKCEKCPYHSTVKEYFNKHVQRIHNKSIVCEDCGKKFPQNRALTIHQMQHKHGVYANTPRESFGCDKCKKSFSTLQYLKVHQNAVHDASEVKCEVCGRICKNQLAMQKHRQIHEKVECSICHKKVTKDRMAHHLRSHSADYLFKCDLCEYSVKRKDQLRNHIESKHLKKKIVNDSTCREDFSHFELPDLSPVNVKEEAPEEFVLVLPQPPDGDSIAPQVPQVEDVELKLTQVEVKEEPEMN